MSRARAVLALLVAAASASITRADRLTLAGGGTIETDSWRFEGDQVVCSGPAGEVRLPRSLVVRIDPAPAGFPAPAPPARARGLDPAAAALARGDFTTAAALYEAALRDAPAPGSTAAAVGYAMSQIALSRDDLALGAVLDALAFAPDHPLLLELLGDLRDREQRGQDALVAWREAFAADPTDRVREKILKAEREEHAARTYSQTRAAHFNVVFDGELDARLSDAVLDHLEQQYWVLADTLDHAPSQPITVVIYPTRQFRDVTQSAEWVGGVYDGKIRVPLGGLRRLDPAAASVLTHELVHAFVHSKTRGACPRWLHEGLAQRLEGRTVTRAEQAALARTIRVADAPAWESRPWSYPAALSLVGHLEARGGLERLVRVLDLLAAGQALDPSLREIYGEGYAELCRSWAAGLAAHRR